MHAPDVAIVVRRGEGLRYSFQGPESFTKPLDAMFRGKLFELPADDLAAQLPLVAAGDVGTIPAIGVELSSADGESFLQPLLSALQEQMLPGILPRDRNCSAAWPARRARRRRSSARFTATDLIKSPTFLPSPSLAACGWANSTDDPAHRTDVEKIVRPYFDGTKMLTPKSGSELAGHLIFTELASRTTGEERDRYIALCASPPTRFLTPMASRCR